MFDLGLDVYYPEITFYKHPTMLPTINKGKIVEIRKNAIFEYCVQPYEIFAGGYDNETHHHRYTDKLKPEILIINERLIFRTELEAMYSFGLLGLKISQTMFKSIEVDGELNK